MLKLLVGAASIAVIAYVAFFFFGQWQMASAKAAADAAEREAELGLAVCKGLLAEINSDEYNKLPKDKRAAIYQSYRGQC